MRKGARRVNSSMQFCSWRSCKQCGRVDSKDQANLAVRDKFIARLGCRDVSRFRLASRTRLRFGIAQSSGWFSMATTVRNGFGLFR